MLIPTLYKNNGEGFFITQGDNKIPKDHVVKLSDFTIKDYPITRNGHDNVSTGIALKDQNYWHIIKCSVGYRLGDMDAVPPGIEYFNEWAFPIDQRMTAEDIEGASHIFKNADNTGWLFSHANHGNHADHEITLMAGIDGIMQPMFRQYHVDVIMGANLAAKERAANQYKLLSLFYGEVVGLARKNARTKHLGERHKDPHPENGHIHSEIKVAYEATKAEWETNRAADVVKIQGAFTYIGTALTIPNAETRWDKAARIEAEKKKKAAEAAAAEEQATNQDTS